MPVTLPANAQAGQLMRVWAGGHDISFAVPPGSLPGSVIHVQVQAGVPRATHIDTSACYTDSQSTPGVDTVASVTGIGRAEAQVLLANSSGDVDRVKKMLVSQETDLSTPN